MESSTQSIEDSVEKPPIEGKHEETLSAHDLSEKSELLKSSSPVSVKNTLKSAKSNDSKDTASTVITNRKTDIKSGSVANSTRMSSTLTKSTISSASRSSGSVPVVRRNSTGGLPGKKPTSVTKRPDTVVESVAGTKGSSSGDRLRRSLPEVRSSLPSLVTRPTSRSSISDVRKSAPISPVARTLRSSSSSDVSKPDYLKKTPVRPSPPSVSSTKRVASTSMDSTGSSVVRKMVGKVSSPSIKSPSVSSGSKGGSLSTSMDKYSNLSSRRKAGTPESRDSRLIMLPQVDSKAGDDVRLDLRGHRIRNLKSSGLNFSPNLEFVYLRDNLLSTLEGIEILNRVKVLDLSFNDFKAHGFEPLENCKVLQQLYLAGNQITSLISLPELPNLEFLSVAQNKLKSLAMASQPRLQVLAASKNKISTLKGFPYLPALEHLRVEENPILKMPHLEAASILLVGPTLKKFNDRDLTRAEVVLSKRYPAHTALCIRGGWEFCRPDQAFDSTFNFLLEQWKEQLPPGYLLKGASVEQPFEEDACCCNFDFVKDEIESCDIGLLFKYQWYTGDKTCSNFTPIPGATEKVYWPKRVDVSKVLKVECTPILGDTEYPPTFAISSPVSPGTGCPKVLKINIQGDLVEGNTVRGHAEIAWCGGTPGKGVSSWLRRHWNSSPVVIAGAESNEYRLTLDDVDSCLVYMFTPVTEEGVKGEAQYAITDHVKAAPPSVNNLQIIGEVMEGNTVRGVGEYFGGREGPSKFEWLREDKNTGEFVLVLTGTNEYPVTKEDIGRRLAFVYIPVNFEGHEGKSMSMTSEIVKQAPPKVTNVKIIGELKEGSKVTASGIVTGGTEGSSRVQWFKTKSAVFEGEQALEALSTSKIAKAFRIPLGAVGYYIVAKFTPMTPDGEVGEPVYAVADKAIETLPPSLNFLSITGEYSEDSLLTASYGYVGGHEGKSIYNWYLHEAEKDLGSVIPELSGQLQYQITKDAIGKFISFTCTPVRDDGILGEPRTCVGQERVRPGSPRLLSLQILGRTIEGTLLNVGKKYWGGDEGDSVYRWIRTSSDGVSNEIIDATTPSYRLSVDDIGFFISVSCEPVRSDGARGPTMLSEKVGPIVPGPPTCLSLDFLGSLIEGEHLSYIASYSGGKKGNCSCEWFRVKSDGIREKIKSGEFLDLTLDDVGECIELVYTPVRDDGIKGNPTSLLSSPIAPGEPVGFDLVIPDCCEGEMVVPQKRYFGGKEGTGLYIWYRTKKKLDISALMNISDGTDDTCVCCKTLSYIPSIDDVGAYLAFYWLPTRLDGKSGKPLVTICDSPVSPALPVISNVRVKEVSSGIYLGEGEYFGGYEGLSSFSWYREKDDGTITPIDGANAKTYEVTDDDYNCCLLFGYTPIRSDSVTGELRLSKATNVILPEIPTIEMLVLTGKAVEGELLTAIEVMAKSESQQKVWTKYKKDVRYQWFCSSEMTSGRSFEPLPSQQSCSYKVRYEDIGRCLRCECIVSDVFGRSSEPAYAETDYVVPGNPRMDKLEIEGRGYHTNLYAVRGIYSGGKEGKSKIQWLRSMVGSPDLITINGETGRMYEANVDDVGYRLVAIYTPVREDGVEGPPFSVSTDPIAVEPDVLKEVKLNLDLGSVKFEVLFNKDRSSKKVAGLGNLERRILEVNRKRVKVVKPGSKTSFPTTEIRGTYAPPFHVELFRNDQHRLRIVVDSENEIDLMVQTRHLRDVIVLVIRGLAQRFNSTSLNSLLKLEA
ncbi:OLC1v1024308C2 [Oldenlandia corymbosa var. corymbosa]|nr:OLC1v1024308C2 [Oldenlandia corymbosa var. corymbosa]